MSTARDLITDAMTEAGVRAQGETLSNDDMQIGLRKLQRMLDSWSLDNLMVYVLTQETVSLAAGDGSYTTANLSTASRPVAITGGFVRVSSSDYPLEMLTRYQWNEIGVKTTQGIPYGLFYNPAMTAGELEFYPVPSETMTAYLNCQRVLTGTLALSTSLSLPPGYEKAIVDNLAVELCSGTFGVAATPKLLLAAMNSKQAIETLNYMPGYMHTIFDPAREYDIEAGQ